MAQQKALFLLTLVVNGERRIDDKAVLKPGRGELVVKIHATALNPINWKIRTYNLIIKDYPAILGSYSAGTVEGFSKGDRVVHQGYYTNNEATFQQYTRVPAEITAKISPHPQHLPSNVSFDQDASVLLGIAAAAIGLYGDRESGIEKYMPAWEDSSKGLYSGKPIVIFGRLTSVGQYAIQLAKLSGFSPIVTTASARYEKDLLLTGATHVIDRTTADVPRKITKVLGGASVKIIYDTISEKDTQTQAWDLLSSGGQLVVSLPSQVDQEKDSDKAVIWVQGNVHLLHARALGVSLYSKLTKLLKDGSIKPNHVEVLPGGLAAIPNGLERLQSGKVSRTRLIVHPQETA